MCRPLNPTQKPGQSAREKREALRKVCQALEVVDCDCPLDLSCPCGESCEGEAAEACPHCRGECDCLPLAYQPPCRHVLQSDHRVAVERWAGLLLAAFPGPAGEGHDDPPPPKRPARAVARQDRVEVYAERFEAGLSLFHPQDTWRPGVVADLKVGVISFREPEADPGPETLSFGEAAGAARKPKRLRNGATNPEETLAIRKAA